jgi:hypothetical protein
LTILGAELLAFKGMLFGLCTAQLLLGLLSIAISRRELNRHN